MDKATGISNRETAAQEESERNEFPPAVDTPQPEDASGRKGDETPGNTDGLQTSHKAGSRSIAQKEADARYPDRSTPPSRKVNGAFGREPKEPEAEQ